MSFSRSVAMLPALYLVSVIASGSGEVQKPRREPGLYSVLLVDDSQINLRLLTEEIEIITAYGKLKIPVADVRRIDLGFRYPEGVEQQVEAAVARLGDADFKVRDAAGKELLRHKELAYMALRRAVQNKDQEVKRRATALVRELENQLPGEQLELQEDDVIVTTRFPITGRIEGLSLKGRSQVFGEVKLQLADMRQVRSLTVEPEAARELLEPARTAVRERTIRSPDPGMYEVRLADGSLLDMRLVSKEIEITTRGGKLKVPVADVRRIDLGFRYPEGVEKQVEAAVARLGDADFKVRDAAGKELLRHKELAYMALRRAVQNKDQEIKRRAAALVRELESQLPREQLELQDQDVIVTTRSPITGRIEGVPLKVQSRFFGEVRLQLADTRQMRSLTAMKELQELRQKSPLQEDSPEGDRLGKVADLFREYAKAYAKVHKQKIPKDIQELKQWAIKDGKATEDDFISTRDHEPYGLSTGMGSGMVYEQTGKRGKRFVFLMGKVMELPSTEVDDKIKSFSGTRLGKPKK